MNSLVKIPCVHENTISGSDKTLLMLDNADFTCGYVVCSWDHVIFSKHNTCTDGHPVEVGPVDLRLMKPLYTPHCRRTRDLYITSCRQTERSNTQIRRQAKVSKAVGKGCQRPMECACM